MLTLHRRGRVRTVSALGLALALVVTGCGSNDDSSSTASSETTAALATTATPATSGPPTDPSEPDEDSTPDRNEGLRGVRYCEVLLLDASDPDAPSAEVWNTMGLSDCPQADWDALDAAAIAEEQEATAAVLNGPRYWLLDAIEQGLREGAPEDTFGAIPMFLAAEIDLTGQSLAQEPYLERTIVRETVFEWAAGETTFQLTSPDGELYVMQSWSQQVDPELDEPALAGLADRLALPAGWSFAVVTPEEPIRALSADGTATVIRDELQNTYQRIDDL